MFLVVFASYAVHSSVRACFSPVYTYLCFNVTSYVKKCPETRNAPLVSHVPLQPGLFHACTAPQIVACTLTVIH